MISFIQVPSDVAVTSTISDSFTVPTENTIGLLNPTTNNFTVYEDNIIVAKRNRVEDLLQHFMSYFESDPLPLTKLEGPHNFHLWHTTLEQDIRNVCPEFLWYMYEDQHPGHDPIKVLADIPVLGKDFFGIAYYRQLQGMFHQTLTRVLWSTTCLELHQRFEAIGIDGLQLFKHIQERYAPISALDYGHSLRPFVRAIDRRAPPLEIIEAMENARLTTLGFPLHAQDMLVTAFLRRLYPSLRLELCKAPFIFEGNSWLQFSKYLIGVVTDPANAAEYSAPTSSIRLAMLLDVALIPKKGL